VNNVHRSAYNEVLLSRMRQNEQGSSQTNSIKKGHKCCKLCPIGKTEVGGAQDSLLEASLQGDEG